MRLVELHISTMFLISQKGEDAPVAGWEHLPHPGEETPEH